MSELTPEQSAAIERLRKARADSAEFNGGYPDTPAGRCLSACDHAHLADLYLTEHPADDVDIVTREWLHSLGVASANLDAAWDSLCDEFDADGGIVGKWNRGKVRKLLSALGIPPQETAT